MPPELAPRIASCKRGFERTVSTPIGWTTEHEVLVLPLAGDGSPLFPACVDCDCADGGIEVMPDNHGVFRRVKECCIQFREPGTSISDAEPQQEVG